MNKPDFKPYYIKDVLEAEKQNNFKVFSLFAGGGGSSTGYRLAGGKVLAVNEFVERAVESYRANYPETKIYTGDIRGLHPNQFLKDFNMQVGDLDILDGSPPCSAFSLSGKRDKGWGTEKSYSTNKTQRVDDLFFEYIRFVKEIQPKVFVAENVKGLTFGNSKNYLLEIVNELKKCGYIVKAKVLNAASFDVPQIRERLIIIGIRNDLYENSFDGVFYPEGSKYSYSFNDVTKGLLNTEFKILKDKELLLWQNTICGQDFGPAHKKIFGSCSWFSHKRLAMNKPANTITTNHDLSHPTEPRTLSIEEIQRLQSLPDDYINLGSFSERWERVGRMVPPKLMQAIANNIYNNILSKL